MKYLLCSAVLLSFPIIAQAQDKGDPPAVEAVGEGAKGAESEPDAETQALIKQLKSFRYQTGEVNLKEGRATLNLPDGYRFLESKDSKVVLEDIWGNPPGAARGIEGMIFPRGQDVADPASWAIVVQFEEDGYVSDSDADEIDYDDLLKKLKEDSAESSKQRVAAGYGKMLLTGWALPPRYDKERKVLYWAKEFITDSKENSLNYDVRVLGRRGVLSLNAIASASQKGEIDAMTPEIVGLVAFNPGHTYAEFNKSTDKQADYTLAGLVIGGAVAAKVLAKGGLLVLLAKFGKLLIIPAIFLIAWLKRKFSRE